MMNLTIQQGWQCPVCQRVYSPMTGLCYYCPTKTTSQSVTEAHEPWCDSLNMQLLSMPPKPAKCNCKGEQT